MIVLDSQDPRDVKLTSSYVAGPTLRRPERVAGRSSSSLLLPDYETSQALEAQDFLRSASSSSVSLISHRHRKSSFKDWWLDSKFRRTVFYAMIVYVILSMGVGIPLIVLKVVKHTSHRLPPPPPLALSWVDEDSHHSPLHVEDGVLMYSNDTTCNHWNLRDVPVSDGQFLSTVNYSLPATGSLAMRVTTLSSKAPSEIVGGNLNVASNSDPKETRALFNIVLHTSSVDLRLDTHMCFQDTGGDRGLLIYVPANLTKIDSLNLEIQLLLPRLSSVNKIKKLATYLPGLKQVFWNLDNHFFKQLNIEGARSDIVFKSIRASSLVVGNSLAAIYGTFNVTRSIHLDNVGGPVHANVTMVHDSSEDSPTFMSIDTGNGDIQAQVLLSAPPKRSFRTKRPNFGIHVQTFNAPIKLGVTHDDSTPIVPLWLRAHNNMAQSNVTIDSKYEGTFDVQTKLAKADIIESPVDSSYDPTGEDRNFLYEYDHKASNRALGWAGWGSRPKYRTHWQSNILIMSSMSPVSLHFREGASMTRTRR